MLSNFHFHESKRIWFAYENRKFALAACVRARALGLVHTFNFVIHSICGLASCWLFPYTLFSSRHIDYVETVPKRNEIKLNYIEQCPNRYRFAPFNFSFASTKHSECLIWIVNSVFFFLSKQFDSVRLQKPPQGNYEQLQQWMYFFIGGQNGNGFLVWPTQHRHHIKLLAGGVKKPPKIKHYKWELDIV